MENLGHIDFTRIDFYRVIVIFPLKKMRRNLKNQNLNIQRLYRKESNFYIFRLMLIIFFFLTLKIE